MTKALLRRSCYWWALVFLGWFFASVVVAAHADEVRYTFVDPSAD